MTTNQINTVELVNHSEKGAEDKIPQHGTVVSVALEALSKMLIDSFASAQQFI